MSIENDGVTIQKGGGKRLPSGFGHVLERLYLLRLQTFWTLHNVELDGLTLLQTAKSIRLYSREMDKYVAFPGIAANKAVTLAIVEPLYCSFFHCLTFSIKLLRRIACRKGNAR